MEIISFILFLGALLLLLSLVIASIVIGPLLKKYNKKKYEAIYVWGLPFSLLILNDYIRFYSDKDIPEDKVWIFKFFNFSFYLFLSFLAIMCFLFWLMKPG